MSDEQVMRDYLAQMIVREWTDGTFGIMHPKTGEIEMRPQPETRIATIVLDMIQVSRAEGRREILREIAAMRPQKGQSWCWFCHAHATIDYSLNHHQDCLWLRAVEATRGTEER